MRKMFGKLSGIMGSLEPKLSINVKHGHQTTVIPCNPGI